MNPLSANDFNYLKKKALFLEPFLSDPSNILERIHSICINDIIPEKVERFEEAYRKRLKKKIIQATFHSTNINLSTKNQSIDDLTDEARANFEKCTIDFSNKLINKRMEAFKNNKVTFLGLNTLNIAPPTLIFDNKDFKTAPSFREDLVKQELHLARKIKLQQVFHKKNNAKFNKDIYSFLEELSSVNAQFAQLKLYVKFSKIIGKKFEELNLLDWEDFQSEIKALKKECEKRQQAQAKIAFDQLMLEEELKSSTSVKNEKKTTEKKDSKSNKKSKAEKTQSINNSSQKAILLQNQLLILSDLEISVLKLIKMPSLYKIHSRVRRWSAELEQIRQFEDYNNKQVVKYYANLSLKELLEAKECHNLGGIEKILSSPFKETYSFPYEFIDEVTKKAKQGLGLFAEKHSQLGKTSGIIYVGISEDNVIYHLHFSIFKTRKLSPAEIAQPLESIENAHIEEKWELTTDYQFSLEGDLIKLEIGKEAQNRVTYFIYPIQ